MKWPDKNEREKFEIKGFIEAYSRLPEARQFQVDSKGDAPDYVVKDGATNEEFGVELTSVYLDDRSVPDVHKRNEERREIIPDDENTLDRYEKRLIAKIIEKVCKARKHYNTARPLILAIYINEYISIYLDRTELDSLVQRYEGVFDSMVPFSEVVFWNLNNEGVFRVRPESMSGHLGEG